MRTSLEKQQQESLLWKKPIFILDQPNVSENDVLDIEDALVLLHTWGHGGGGVVFYIGSIFGCSTDLAGDNFTHST